MEANTTQGAESAVAEGTLLPLPLLGVDWTGPAAVGCMAAVVLTIVAEPLFNRFDLKCLAKTAASTCFLWTALASASATAGADGQWSAFAQVVFASLALGWLGDVCLLSPGKRAFLVGLVSFLVGHLGFAYAFACLGPPGEFDGTWLAGGCAVMAPQVALVYAYLRNHLKGFMKYAVVIYMLVISFMLPAGMWAGRGVDTKQFNLLVGSFIFWMSDLSVARNAFVSKGPENAVLGLPLYYAAQLIIASNMF
ncbi:uncharacterized protein ACA1_095530 [Acanthamoeba castellanii str. Neff]|uniref:Transmembrane protein, putative n=1 Tax=Acanthamoeba castellanii (strain ATCC 30010 / Neff) TaxID=1257118 RepID=L8GJI4_ACACF|nr:uncharacterized protein ACA1_095530 [Acanthamoeba castellanii str. Neff]ELR12903.1 transmembrane protein, putative [Acanthamoeba castellanii str. Neff]